MRIGGVDGFPLLIDLGDAVFDSFRLEIAGEGRLQFNEFQAWSRRRGVLENVALHQPCEQSSTPFPRNGAPGGNSGNVHLTIGAITDLQRDPWWEVSFGVPIAICHVVLFNRIAWEPDSMDSLRICGGRDGEWTCVFDQHDSATVRGALADRLSIEVARANSVLAHAVVPQQSASDANEPRLGSGSLPSWEDASRLDSLVALVSELERVILDEASIDSAILRMLRSSARLALPRTRTSAHAHDRVVATDECEWLELRTWHANEDRPVTAVRPIEHSSTPMRPASARSLAVDHDTPRMVGVQRWETPEDTYVVSFDGAGCRNAKWELWAVGIDGNQSLVFDSLQVSGLILVILQTAWSVGLSDFETLDGILSALEHQDRLDCAVAISEWLDTADPGTSRFERSLQEVELRSTFDPSRDSTTRTKHGYKTTHRFMEPSRYAAGTDYLSALAREHPDCVEIFPAFGTLLGFVRSDGFIPHDDDADLLVCTNAQNRDEMMQIREKMQTHLQKQPHLRVFDGSRLPGLNIPVGFDHEQQWVHVDLFFTYFEAGDLMLFNDRLKCFEVIDPDLLTLGRQVTIHGVTFDIPVRSEDLLEVWYGANWRVPQTSYLLGYSWQRD